MRKFVEELAEPAAVINVRWRTPAKGQPPGTIVRLDVRRTGASGAQSFEIAYPGRLAGRVSTNFRVPRLPGEGADGIASWRVQVIHTGRVIAEQASASWK